MPSLGAMSKRRFMILLAAAASFLIFSSAMLFRRQPNHGQVPIHHVEVSPETLTGHVIMPHLGNETLRYVDWQRGLGRLGSHKFADEWCLARAEIGRAGWKLFHTTMARFPDTPTQDESTALQSYIHLFARLYPW